MYARFVSAGEFITYRTLSTYETGKCKNRVQEVAGSNPVTSESTAVKTCSGLASGSTRFGLYHVTAGGSPFHSRAERGRRHMGGGLSTLTPRLSGAEGVLRTVGNLWEGPQALVLDHTATVESTGRTQGLRIVPSHLYALVWGMKIFRRHVAFTPRVHAPHD